MSGQDPIGSHDAPDRAVVPPATIPGGARRGGTTVGIVLVCVGVLMLFGSYVPWFDLFRLWPLLIVVGGVVEMFRGRREPALKRFAEGLGSVALGFVLLGNTLGYLQWSVWVTILSLWPLLVVALGIELLGRGLGLTWVRALSNFVLLAGLLYGVFVMQPGTVGVLNIPGVTRTGESFSDSARHDPAVRDGRVVVSAGAAYLKVGAGSDLARISGSAPAGSPPKLVTTVTSGTAEVAITDPPQRPLVLGMENRTVDIELDESVAWGTLQLEAGAIRADADLSGLDIAGVSLRLGASDLLVTLGSRSDNVLLEIYGGAANVTVRVPKDAKVTVDSTTALSNVTVPPGFERLSGIPYFGESSWAKKGSGGPNIEVSMRSGVSNLTIETY